MVLHSNSKTAHHETLQHPLYSFAVAVEQDNASVDSCATKQESAVRSSCAFF